MKHVNGSGMGQPGLNLTDPNGVRRRHLLEIFLVPWLFFYVIRHSLAINQIPAHRARVELRILDDDAIAWLVCIAVFHLRRAIGKVLEKQAVPKKRNQRRVLRI